MHEAITHLDRVVAVALSQAGRPRETQVMEVVTFFGGGIWIATVSAVVAAALGWMKRWRDVVVLLTAVVGADLLMQALKLLVHRARPEFVRPLIHAGGYSFPSGHATTSVALYLVLALLSFGWVRRRAARVCILAGALTLSALIGFSRLYLGVHYLSDVLAGFVLGAVWVAVCVTAGVVHDRRAGRAGRHGGGT